MVALRTCAPVAVAIGSAIFVQGFVPSSHQLMRPTAAVSRLARVRLSVRMQVQQSDPKLNGAAPSQDSSSSGGPQNAEGGGSSNKSQAEIEASRLIAAAAKLREEAAQLMAEQADQRAKESDKVFKMFDSNKDGTLNVQELRAGLESMLKQSVSEERAQQLLTALDTNGDGVLQPNEVISVSGMANKLREIADRELEAANKLKAEAAKETALAKEEAQRAALVNDKPATGAERALATLPFLLPLLDGALYGRFLLDGPAQAGNPVVIGLLGLLAVFRSVPLSQFAAFIGLSFLGDNLKVNRLIRHNALQSVYLDVALFPASLIIASANLISQGNVDPQLLEYGSDFVFIVLSLGIIYSLGVTLTGGTPDGLPIISNVVRQRLDRMSAREFMKRGEDDKDNKGDRK